MKITDQGSIYLERAITIIEWVVAAALVVIAGFGAVVLGRDLIATLTGQAEGTAAFIALLDATLLVFIVAELFKIALAYIRHEDVIPTVMEAALVAVARKLVVLDSHVPAMQLLMKAGALGLLLVAVGLSWFLLSRANPKMAALPEE